MENLLIEQTCLFGTQEQVYIVLFVNHTKLGTTLIETALTRESLYLVPRYKLGKSNGVQLPWLAWESRASLAVKLRHTHSEVGYVLLGQFSLVFQAVKISFDISIKYREKDKEKGRKSCEKVTAKASKVCAIIVKFKSSILIIISNFLL